MRIMILSIAFLSLFFGSTGFSDASMNPSLISEVTGKSLKEKIAKGQTFYFQFDDWTKPIIGTFRIQKTYKGKWKGNGVEVEGYNRRKRRVITVFYHYPTYQKRGRNLSLWGFKAYFNEKGILYKQGSNQKIGKIWV